MNELRATIEIHSKNPYAVMEIQSALYQMAEWLEEMVVLESSGELIDLPIYEDCRNGITRWALRINEKTQHT